MSGGGKREVRRNPNFEEQPGVARTKMTRSAAAPSGSGGSPVPPTPTRSQSVAEREAVAEEDLGGDVGWTRMGRRRK